MGLLFGESAIMNKNDQKRSGSPRDPSHKFDEEIGTPSIVIPAEAGIQNSLNSLDSGSR